ncbi:hypothetical protein [Nostoc sp. GT001]|uniref:hypothetical protein n=1 Tax=Nostoc sp. GT001 TaxID=3056647 RepID=UPI0025AA7B9B|nr:hypothetical protein [Nostoc sp. GT001]MDM9583971.1 hypothetical protein [Nostoc sp. GT001]
MLNKFESSSVFVLVLSISNLSLIDYTLASKIKGLKQNQANVITQNYVSDRWDSIAIDSELNSVKSNLFFQSENYKGRLSKQYQFTISQGAIPPAMRQLAESLRGEFKKVSSIEEADILRQELSQFPEKISLSKEEYDYLQRVVKGNGRFQIVVFGTVVTLTGGGIYICVKEECAAELVSN